MSARRVTLDGMDVTDADVAGIPPRNLRVPREEFVEVWRTAVRLDAEHSLRGVQDWYAGAIATTCRWLAAAPVRPGRGPWGLASAPVTKRSTSRAYEELIQEELLAAERLDMQSPRPAWLVARPGWSEGIVATLRWAWARTGPAPIPVDVRAAG